MFIGKILGLSKIYPGNIKNLLLTITAISPKYNGACWFITTYILLVLSSPLINKSIFNKKIIFKVFLVFIFYFVAYIQRFKSPIQTEINLVNYILKQISLFGVSLLPYYLGAIFAEKMFYSKIYKYINSKVNKKYVDLGGLIFILSMMIFHDFFETVFIAPFTGIGFIISFNLINKGKWIETLLDYLSIHSTNIWLTHMFFYMIYFKKIIFYPKYLKTLNKLFIKSYKKKLKIS